MSGQALAEGTVALALLVTVGVGLVLLITGVGLVQFYQLKLLNVAQVMAQEVVANTFWEGRQVNPKPTNLTASQQAKTQQLLQALGLPSNNFNVELSDVANNCVFKITVNGLPIIGGGILPNVVTLSANAVQPWSIFKPPFAISIATSVGPIQVPAYRPQGTNGFPNISDVGTFSGPLRGFVNLGAGAGGSGINLGGFGTSSPSGSPTDTGGFLSAFAPYVGTPFPQPTTFPAF